MRFISKYALYSICYQADVVNHFGDGNSQVVKPLLNCQFAPLGMHPWEMEAAREKFLNRGLGVYEDRVTQEDPAGRFSVFDTTVFQRDKQLTDEQREDIEKWLLARWECGSKYIMVEQPQLPLPWPSYHDARPEGVAGIAATIGCLREALAYEQQNGNRPKVIAEIEELIVRDLEPVEDDTDLVAA